MILPIVLGAAGAGAGLVAHGYAYPIQDACPKASLVIPKGANAAQSVAAVNAYNVKYGQDVAKCNSLHPVAAVFGRGAWSPFWQMAVFALVGIGIGYKIEKRKS